MHRVVASSKRRALLSTCLCDMQKSSLLLWTSVVRDSHQSIYSGNVKHCLTSYPYLATNSQHKSVNLVKTNVRSISNSGKPPDFNDVNKVTQKEMQESEDMYSKKARFEKFFGLVRNKGPQLQSFKSNAHSDVTMKTSPISVKTDKKEVEDWNDILNRWYENYQEFVGITDLKRAQDKVTELSEILLETQSRRRKLQAEIEKLQESLIVNQQRITKTELYSDEHYTLFDQAREMNASLKTMRGEFEVCERTERDTFSQLSAAIRDCHERERFQAEQSKYWSIIASVVSAALASIITSVNNWVRIREVKDHVTSNSQELIASYTQMHNDVVNSISKALNTPVSSSIINTESVGLKETISAVSLEGESQEKAVVQEMAQKGSVSESDLIVLKDSVSSTKKDMALLTKSLGSLKDDISSLTKSTEQTLKEHVASLLSEERKILYRQINSQLETIFTKVFLATEKHAGDNVILTEEHSNALPLEWDEKAKSEVVLVDYSYRRIATAMAVGAGIGTLLTAFMLGSFPANG